MTYTAPNLHRLEEYDVVSVDAETTGTYWYRHTVFGIAIAARTRDGAIRAGYWDIRSSPWVVNILRDKLPLVKTVVNHHIKFDMMFLKSLGIEFRPGSAECTMVRAALINEHEISYSLDSRCKDAFGEGKAEGIYEELAAMFGGKADRKTQMPNLCRAPESLAKRYAIEDPVLAIRLWDWQNREIENQDLHQVWSLEKELLPVLVDIERGGVRVDIDKTSQNLESMDERIRGAQEALNKLVGWDVNVNSSPQMRKVFGVTQRDDKVWVTSAGFPLPKTETGAPSIDADVLRSLSVTDERARAVGSIRMLTKAKQFLDGHILGHEVKGYVYPNYNQTRGENDLGTGTGRFSVDDPALQQIPKRNKEVAAIVRACFVPDQNDHTWVSADWDQFEFRWFAHYVNNKKLNETYTKDPSADFHQMVSDLTGLSRSARFSGDPNAKQINLGLVFGMGEGKMAAEMGLPYEVRQKRNSRGEVVKEWLEAGEEAKGVFQKYHSAVPGVKDLLSDASSIAKSRGYVKTIYGRRIRFPRGQFTHKAGGLVFQGSSADCMKRKMIEIHPMAKEAGVRMLLSVHDELDFSMHKRSKFHIKIKEVLETFDGDRCPIKCRIPIRSSVTHGSNWWEASK